MAEKQMVPVRLWDEASNVVAEVEYDAEDVPEGALRPDVLEHGGKTYVWNQRNGQYRIASPVKVGGTKQDLTPAQTAEAQAQKAATK